ncbi:restriction endonuclease, partial [Salmonella enterica subsp. enterica serovar Agona]|nr:restriction endonuclease [Salmonella enterica subsp. enterica serovar Agona]
MHNKKFDRSEHVYRNDSFLELIKDAVRFFSGTPVHSLPPPERFQGAGVYALYYTGHYSLYDEYSRINRL